MKRQPHHKSTSRFLSRSTPKKTKLRKGSSKKFWDKEYAQSGHLALSNDPSEDLVKFTRFLEREFGRKYLNPLASVADLGSGNGRNLIYLAETYGMRGIGYDISSEAVTQANRLIKTKELPIVCSVQSIASPLPLPDSSQTLVLDMMASHFLNSEERLRLRDKIVRVLRKEGFLFFKTFLRDEDKHAERLLRENPASEPGSYIHPKIGVAEHVFTESEIEDFLKDHFFIHKITKSHRHRERLAKRRSISVYAQKIG